MRTRTMRLVALFGAIAVVASVAAAHDYQFHSLKIDHPFARATPPGARSGGVFFTVENTGTAPDRLLSVSSPMAGVAELHEMWLDRGVMRMPAVSAVEVKPGHRLGLKPGGHHAMLSVPNHPLRFRGRFQLFL